MQKRIFITFALIVGLLGSTDDAATQSRLHREVLDSTQQIVYTIGSKELCLVDGQGNKPEKLLEIEDGIFSPTWSPEVTNIAFFKLFDRKQQKAQLVIYDMAKREYQESSILEFSATSPTWSPQGTKIAFFKFFDQKQQKAQLVIYDPAKREYQESSAFDFYAIKSGYQEGEVVIIPPHWSPDGKYLFVTDSKGIHRVDLAGEAVRLVQKENLREVAFSSDGLQIAYTDRKTLYLANADGKDEFIIAEKSPSFNRVCKNDTRKLAYSPDGTQLAIGEKDHYKLFSLSTVGADLVKLYAYDYMDVRGACPHLSVDGRYVAFISKPTRSDEKVFVAATDGSGWIQLIKKGRCASPSWRPHAAQ